MSYNQNQLGTLWKSHKKKQKKILILLLQSSEHEQLYFHLCLISRLINTKKSLNMWGEKKKTFFYLILTGSSCHDISYH